MKRAMKPFGLAVAVLGLVAGAGERANAAQMIDQQQSDSTVILATFSQGGLAQSFKQVADNITGASIQLFPLTGSGTGTADITISLYNNLPNVGGTLLASGTATGKLPNDLATVSFGTAPISIVPELTYFLVFTSTNSVFGLGGSILNPYARGQAYATDTTVFQSFPTFDYAFQTFADDGVVVGAAVPEPSTLAMGTTALLLGLGYGWRRRKAAVA